MDHPFLPAEIRDLIERVALRPRGVGFLHRGDLESVAVTFGVHPSVVEAARAWLESEEGREAVLAEVRRTRSDARKASVARPEEASAIPLESESSAGAQDLIDRVSRHSLGLRFLLHAPPETVAVTYRVHPAVVFEAREIVRRGRGSVGERLGGAGDSEPERQPRGS